MLILTWVDIQEKGGSFINHPVELLNVLFKVWSLESSSLWTCDNPAKGQCGVTALVVNDIFGGEIFKTMMPNGWHFYNIIDGQRFDLTESQFSTAIDYMGIKSSRDEALSDTNDSQYYYLRKIIINHLEG